MLDACAGLVDEIGYEALTTTLLAERAGVAIGSIYQFFPDKRAVVQALTLRNLEAYLSRLTERFAEAQFSHWWDGVDAGIDEYIAMHRDVPGFRTLHFGDVVDVHLLDEVKDNNAVIAGALVQRASGGEPIAPDPAASHAADTLSMMLGRKPDAREVAALDAYLVTVCDHGMNASTFTTRVVASTQADLFAAVTAGYCALT